MVTNIPAREPVRPAMPDIGDEADNLAPVGIVFARPAEGDLLAFVFARRS
jgi:hypothetical protein